MDINKVLNKMADSQGKIEGDNLDKLVKSYGKSELSLDELDMVYAATQHPKYEELMKKVLDKKD